jgi:hypothetical protein
MEIILAIEKFLLQIQGVTGIQNSLKIVIVVFSLLLLAISISAYRKTGFKKILYATAAFAIFGAQALFDFLSDYAKFFDTAYNEIIIPAMTIAILVLFFLAVVKRTRNPKSYT